MNDSKSTTCDTCPACSSTNIDTAFDFAPGRCLECNFVIDRDTRAEIPSSELTTTASRQSESGQDWKHQVELQDSSDENLVQLVERSETIAEDVLAAEAETLQAVEVVIEAWTSSVTHGRSIDLVAAASVEIACRRAGKPRPRAIIADAASVDRTTLKSTCETILNELGETRCSTLPCEYVCFIKKQIGGSMKARTAAEHTLAAVDERPPGNPVGIAAAAVYLGMKDNGEDVTLRQVARAVGLTKETVWSRVDDLRNSEAR